MSRFVVERTSIDGLQIIKRLPIGDERGYFERMFCRDELKAIIDQRSIVQINHTLTAKRGTLRGMHFQQAPYAEMKLVSCLRGEVFDVAVDLREGSPTFLQWQAEILSENNHRTLCIPEGFAHGFQTLTDNCELIYLHTAVYAPEAEAGLNALDPHLAIDWPMPIGERSARDQQHAMLNSDLPGLPT
jgi:dTDP-4-dehydrorhamnose 3,5-epimerase